MSGPKVVRIVTREELVDICRGHLARVDSALAEWIRVARRNDCLDEEALAAAQRRRDTLGAMLEADRFMDLQKEAPQEEVFLRRDMQDRLLAMAVAQAEARSRERRGKEAGVSLLQTLRDRNAEIEDAFAGALLSGDGAALTRGFEMLAETPGQSSAAANSLAKDLKESGMTRAFASWLNQHHPAISDPSVARVEQRLAELAQFIDGPALIGLRERLSEAEDAPSARRNLILDGLEVETGRMLENVRRRAALVLDYRALIAECDVAGAEKISMIGEIDRLETKQIEEEIAVARKALAERRAEVTARARRTAMLEGLRSLGYELTEGMTAATPESGKLIMRSRARPDYGVELSEAASAEKVQVRPVAFDVSGRGPDPSRDRDAEIIWCGDVSTLQAHLSELGGDLVIEKSLPIGQVPLKRIATIGVAEAIDRASPRQRAR